MALVFFSAGVTSSYFITNKIINSNQEIIIRALEKNTTEIKNQFDKIKTKGNLGLEVNSAITDSVHKGFFNKLFKNKKK